MIARALAAILVMAAITILLRAAPFLLFSRRKPPAVLEYLQTYLPAVVMSLLVANSLKGYDWAATASALFALASGEASSAASRTGDSSGAAFLPLAALAGVAATALAHATRRNVLLSIVAGTGTYMLLIRLLA